MTVSAGDGALRLLSWTTPLMTTDPLSSPRFDFRCRFDFRFAFSVGARLSDDSLTASSLYLTASGTEDTQ